MLYGEWLRRQRRRLDGGWGRTGPDSLADFTDVIWINATSGQPELAF